MLLAAGSGTRFGADKTTHLLRGRPVWHYSLETFLAHPGIEAVGLVGPSHLEDPRLAFRVEGGSTRSESSRIAVAQAAEYDAILIHDAARPFVTNEVIEGVLEGVQRTGAAAPAVGVVDTVRQVGETVSLIPRETLRAMQTPQGARVELLASCPPEETTDEMELLARQGLPFEIVPGDPQNFKITTRADLQRVAGVLGPPETRTGLGYDIHAFSEDPHRELWLGGLHFPGETALEGHSDADVILHAVADALLGAIAQGDIGQHFPNTDERWRGARSIEFVREIHDWSKNLGWRIVNIDVSVLAEKPKIMKRASEMCELLAETLRTDRRRINVKATTNERLGAIGRAEGIAAFAVATLTQSDLL